MKIKCIDGKVRNFRVAHYDGDSNISGTWEAKCEDCGKLFGVHDTKILKPKFINHICEEYK